MKKTIKYSFLFLIIVCISTVSIAYYRITHERENLLDDLDRRAKVIAKTLSPASIRALKNPPNLDEEDLAERLSGQGRTMGIVLCTLNGEMVARSAALDGLSIAQRPR